MTVSMLRWIFFLVFMRVHILRLFSLAGIVTLLCGLIYTSVQQDIRQSANDPQIQMAETTASALATGVAYPSVLPMGTIDIATSLVPYIILFDDAGQPVAASGLLKGKIPELPVGVFERARTEEHRFTWQPQEGVRSAVVLRHYDGPHPGFVLAGKSLRDVEDRQSQLIVAVGIGWVASLVMVLGASLF